MRALGSRWEIYIETMRQLRSKHERMTDQIVKDTISTSRAMDECLEEYGVLRRYMEKLDEHAKEYKEACLTRQFN